MWILRRPGRSPKQDRPQKDRTTQLSGPCIILSAIHEGLCQNWRCVTLRNVRTSTVLLELADAKCLQRLEAKAQFATSARLPRLPSTLHRRDRCFFPRGWAVLSQKKNDLRIHPVQYASRTLNQAERNYSACEREALAVIFALKKFRIYLLSETFTLGTNHQALRHAFQKNDVHGRLARWPDLLAEYDFRIVYLPGEDNHAADYLYRPARGMAKQEMKDGLVLHVSDNGNFESLLLDVQKYLTHFEFSTDDGNYDRRVKRASNSYLFVSGQLFRRTVHRIRVIPPGHQRVGILKSFHDDIGHSDLNTTRQFMSDRYWWPRMHRDIHDYVRSCHDCQIFTPLPNYPASLKLPLTTLFDVFSIDFAGPYPTTSSGHRYILVAVEHLTGWPIAMTYPNCTSAVVLAFLKNEIMFSFGSPRKIISDITTSFLSTAVEEFSQLHGISWKPVLAYAPQSNRKAERMVGTIKKSVAKMVYKNAREWDKRLPKVLYGYRRRRLAEGCSPFELLYVHPPRLSSVDATPLLPACTLAHRQIELLASANLRAKRHDHHTKSPSRKTTEASQIGEKVLVCRGGALHTTVKWPSLISKYYGPCTVRNSDHPRYVLCSQHRRLSRGPIHARRLVRYYQRPDHLLN